MTVWEQYCLVFLDSAVFINCFTSRLRDYLNLMQLRQCFFIFKILITFDVQTLGGPNEHQSGSFPAKQEILMADASNVAVRFNQNKLRDIWDSFTISLSTLLKLKFSSTQFVRYSQHLLANRRSIRKLYILSEEEIQEHFRIALTDLNLICIFSFWPEMLFAKSTRVGAARVLLVSNVSCEFSSQQTSCDGHIMSDVTRLLITI